MPLLLKALILGIVEGITEFLPISSTAHLILAGKLVDYPDAQRTTFEIFIQVGAILAVFWHFRRDLLDLARRTATDPAARELVGKVALAFLPAALVGVLLHHSIERYLFGVVPAGCALIAGGVLILLLESRRYQPTIESIERTTWRDALWVGVAQTASLFPGVSRAGSTIVGGILVGMSRPVATQFSFFLALPTVSAASMFSLLQNIRALTVTDVAPFVVGLVAAFLSALIVVRTFIVYMQSHGLRPFGYYRIVAGLLFLLLAG